MNGFIYEASGENEFIIQLVHAKNINKFIEENKGYFLEICERDELIKIGIDNHLNLDEIQKILLYANSRKLYPYFKRDALLIHCISQKMSLELTNKILLKFNEPIIKLNNKNDL